MALDLGTAKSIGVPAWLRALVCSIAILALAGDAVLAWLGLHDPAHKEWFTSAVQVAGTIIPLFIAALLLAFSTSGPETLRRKTADLLLHLIPRTIEYAVTSAPAFTPVEKARRHGRYQSGTSVHAAYHPGDFYCRYRVEFTDVWTASATPLVRVAYLVMDLKVYGANMYLCVPRDRFDSFARQSGAADRWQAFREAFRHTLNGAEAAGCKVNDKVVELDLDGAALACIVVMRTLTPTFISDPSEQLYLAQDLVAMLRSFWRERVDWFPARDRAAAAASQAKGA